jgi:hypothetical protein
MAEVTIPRPDISVAQIVLLILAQMGRASFRQIQQHPQVKLLGAARSENSFYTALARLKRRRMIVRTADHHYELTSSGEYASLKAYVRKEFTEAERKSVMEKKSEDQLRGQDLDRESRRQKVWESTRTSVWDGKWRIVLFDIPEGKRPIRDYLRGVLKRQGFQEFQRSMWVWPYRLPAFMKKVLADPQMRKYTRAITTYDIDYDEDLRRRFRLS